MTKRRIALVALALMIFTAGCATQYAPDRVNNPYGFFFGIWHGMICPLAILGKLLSWLVSLVGISFLDDLTIFGKPNTGFWYYGGFVLGLLGASGGGGSQAHNVPEDSDEDN